VADASAEDLQGLLDLAEAFKAGRSNAPQPLGGKAVGLLFREPSTRTRVSFEVAVHELGGYTVCLAPDELQLARGESLRDTALVLSRYLTALVVRTLAHAEIEAIARHASIPVINALSERAHPCQALADLLTIRERLRRLEGVRLAYVGAGTNVCASLLVAAAKLGLHAVAACPTGYAPAATALEAAEAAAAESGGTVELATEPRQAVAGADVVYTDVWTSMGQEAERQRRREALRGYRVDEELLEHAPNAIVMHCLPAHHGEEVAEGLLYTARSAVWDQAENRLHTQKALLALLVG
jgi:ornithine carbamoyltransferase